MQSIAEALNLDVETVRNYFGGWNYSRGKSLGVHYENGPDGGIVELDDSTILEFAKQILDGKRTIKNQS
jgi:hypothetical protein